MNEQDISGRELTWITDIFVSTYQVVYSISRHCAVTDPEAIRRSPLLQDRPLPENTLCGVFQRVQVKAV